MKANTFELSALRELLDVNVDTGSIFYRPRSVEWFFGSRAETSCKIWNKRFAGAPALAVWNDQGYLIGRVDRVPLRAHRVVWAFANGRWPVDEIDHINRNRSDNRIVNLREADRTLNMRNLSRRRDNKTGVAGVSYHVRDGLYSASIGKRGTARGGALGYFKSFDDACAARRKAEEILGYRADSACARRAVSSFHDQPNSEGAQSDHV